MKKLLIGTALASAMMFSSVALAETKVSGYFETNVRMLDNDASSTDNPGSSIGTEMDMNISSTNELDNGMTMKIFIGTTSEGVSGNGWGQDSYNLSLVSGDTTLSLNADRGPTIDMVSDVVPNPVDQPVDLHGKSIVDGDGKSVAIGGKGVAGKPTDIQGAVNFTLQQKFDGGTVAVGFMPSSANAEGSNSSYVNNDTSDYSGYSIAGKFDVMEGLTVALGHEKKPGYALQDAASTTYGVSYSAGDLSVGAQKTKNDEGLECGAQCPNAVKVDYTGTHYGAAYKVSDALTVGVAIQTVEKSGAALDEEYQQIEAAYSLGALGIGLSYGQVENLGTTAGNDEDQLMIRLSSKL